MSPISRGIDLIRLLPMKTIFNETIFLASRRKKTGERKKSISIFLSKTTITANSTNSLTRINDLQVCQQRHLCWNWCNLIFIYKSNFQESNNKNKHVVKKTKKDSKREFSLCIEDQNHCKFSKYTHETQLFAILSTTQSLLELMKSD
jgi:hypothetical protein